MMAGNLKGVWNQGPPPALIRHSSSPLLPWPSEPPWSPNWPPPLSHVSPRCIPSLFQLHFTLSSLFHQLAQVYSLILSYQPNPIPFPTPSHPPVLPKPAPL